MSSSPLLTDHQSSRAVPSPTSTSSSSSCSSPDPSQPDYCLLNDKSSRKKRTMASAERKESPSWSQRSKTNLSAKRSRVKRRVNDFVLENKVSQLSEENEVLRAKIKLLTRKFGNLSSQDEEQEELKSTEQPSMSNLTDSSPPTVNHSTERSSLDQTPIPVKWRLKFFNLTSTS